MYAIVQVANTILKYNIPLNELNKSGIILQYMCRFQNKQCVPMLIYTLLGISRCTNGKYHLAIQYSMLLASVNTIQQKLNESDIISSYSVGEWPSKHANQGSCETSY